MQQITHKELLEAGVHFGHLKKKWNPKMLPYIFMEKRGIHIIDLHKTHDKLETAAAALKSIARSGKKILFVATKKQAKSIVKEHAERVNMPYVTERWLGGMLTNFATIRKSIKKMQSMEKMLKDGSAANITKKERLVMTREKDKMERVLGGIAPLGRIPAAIFLVDTVHEHIALSESHKLNITTFAMVDTNADPTVVNFPIPANDDATKSIEVIARYITNAIQEGLEERKQIKSDLDEQKAKKVDEVFEKNQPEEAGAELNIEPEAKADEAAPAADAKAETTAEGEKKKPARKRIKAK